MRATMSLARSTPDTSMTAKEARTSFSSAKGPSVTTTLPSVFRTVMEVAG